MARATTTVIPVKPVKPDYKVTLDLTSDEAGTLYGVLERVRGPLDGPHGHTSAIRWALHEAGVRGGFGDSDVYSNSREIYFIK